MSDGKGIPLYRESRLVARIRFSSTKKRDIRSVDHSHDNSAAF